MRKVAPWIKKFNEHVTCIEKNIYSTICNTKKKSIVYKQKIIFLAPNFDDENKCFKYSVKKKTFLALINGVMIQQLHIAVQNRYQWYTNTVQFESAGAWRYWNYNHILLKSSTAQKTFILHTQKCLSLWSRFCRIWR